MLDKNALISRAIAWEKAHPPNTGYTEEVFRNVCGANLPNGTNLLVQIAAQFTGKEESGIDLVHWDEPEERAPYSNDAKLRMTLDGKPDCSSFWYVMYKIFFQINIGTWTEEQYSILKSKSISWANRRPGDYVLFNFKASQGRKASHGAAVMGNGLIGHTTSPSNPFRFQEDTYGASSRVGVYRVLTDAQYNSLLVTDFKSNKPVILTKGMSGAEIKAYQMKIDAHLAKALKGTGYFGDNTVACVKLIQFLNNLSQTGSIDVATRAILDKKP